jgi:glycosyltransferase involved in cell wall biosynthesis
MKVALAHDWLTGMRGGEKVLEVLCEIFPEADLFTLCHRPGTVSAVIERHRITTSFIQRLPRADTHYRLYLPLFPLAVRGLDLSGHDLVISASHCVAKAVVPPRGARHLCYCFSPMRYAWDQFDAYFGPERVGPLQSRWLYRPVLGWLGRWDAATAGRVDRFVAISRHVAERIRRYYNRDATIVYPPVDTVFYHPAAVPAEGHVLIVSALVPYKRIDLAIDAAARVGVRLRVVGQGPERARLERLAGDLGAPVEFLGWRTDEDIRDEYRKALAVLLPGEEDFGIVPLEAQACGRPVIAYARGGALETVVGGDTGVFFREATGASLAAAIGQLAALRIDPARIRAHAERFSRSRHVAALRAVIDETATAPAGRRW